MSVLTDPATYGILNSELTNCPRTAAVRGELGAQWQQMTGTLQRVEQEAVSSQSLAYAIERIGRTRTEATAGRLRCWSGSTPIGGLIQRITKRTLRATEAWTDGRHAEDDKHVELDCQLAVALANATERRSKSRGPEDGFVALQTLVDGYAPKSSSDLAIELQPILATPKRCKGAKELKEGLTAWSLKVAERGEGDDAKRHRTGSPDGTENV